MVIGKVRNQRGAGNIGCLFLVAVVAATMYAGYQFGIPRLRHNSFETRITETFAGNPQRLSSEDAKKQIIEIAREFDIDLVPDKVKVESIDAIVKIDLSYEKVIDLKVWQTTQTFHLVRTPSL